MVFVLGNMRDEPGGNEKRRWKKFKERETDRQTERQRQTERNEVSLYSYVVLYRLLVQV